MRVLVAFVWAVVLVACSGGSSTPAPVPVPDPPPTPAPFGLTERVGVTGVTFPLAPPPPSTVGLERAFPNLTFALPVQLTHAPDGTDRIFVVENDSGRILVFPNSDSATSATTFLDISSLLTDAGAAALVSLAFDPDYTSNGSFYVMYFVDSPMRTRISRFTVSANPDVADPTSESVVIEVTQPHRQHNGNMMAFGPDGMLYASFGDGGGQGDPFGNGQDTTSLNGTIIRIDPDGAAPYRIPSDNPFVGDSGVRDEIYAYGFRNPWRFSFDRSTGALWVGDVGQDTREEIDVVTAGGNYGWPVREGTVAHDGGQPATSFLEPVIDYGRTEGVSVTGGCVYRGNDIPSLAGRYVYGDFNAGTVWSLAYDGASVTTNERIGSVREVVSFGEDRDGEVYAVSYRGEVYRVAATGGGGGGDGELPERLSETGLFASTVELTPAPGMIEYDVNAPLWSDGARKRRWIALPGSERIGFNAAGAWTFPLGTVMVKHFEIEVSAGTFQRVETRVMVREQAGWAGYTYKWNFLQSDADLLPGADTDTYGSQTWNFPSRAQCNLCHTAAAGFVLGVTTRQLNRDFAYAATTDNQLRSWNNIGLFTTDIGDAAGHDAMVDPDDGAQPLADRARAYLDVNCAQCHRPGGTTPTDIDFRWGTAIDAARLVDVLPTQGGLGLVSPYRIRTGAKESSVVWERMGRLDATRMPNLGTNVVDGAGRAMLGDWIDLGARAR